MAMAMMLTQGCLSKILWLSISQRHCFSPACFLSMIDEEGDKCSVQAPVVQKVDSSIHRINHYPVDSPIGFPNNYPLDRDLSDG